MRPFIDDYKEVKIRPETHLMTPVKAITKDGIQNTFREINVITTVRKDKLIFMAKKFGVDFKKSLIFDRIKEDLRLILFVFSSILYTFHMQDFLCKPHN